MFSMNGLPGWVLRGMEKAKILVAPGISTRKFIGDQAMKLDRSRAFKLRRSRDMKTGHTYKTNPV